MSLRRPASGRRVGAGILRVDAARAIQKLREYQLANPISWILESIRAAVASGATRIDLQGDSNDIWLRWNGPAWERAHLPELLSELVSPASAQHGQELRLLATGINSALGLDLAYIDLYRIENQQAEKVRYMPELLETTEVDGESLLLKTLTLEEAEVPSRVGDASMFLHLRRRVGLEPLRNLLRGEPPEFEVARVACGDLAVPITIGKQEFGSYCKQSDVLRVPLERDIDGFLALLDPADMKELGQTHVSEHGVRIASYILKTIPGFTHASVPVRLYVNAERMPTNASRSDVRRTAHPIKAAESQLPDLIEKLCAQLFALLEPGAKLDMPEQRREELRAGALALLASAVAGSNWDMRAWWKLDGPCGELAKLSLLRNAGGSQRSLVDSWEPDILHVGREPLPENIRDSFCNVLWVPPGDPAAALMAGDVDPAAMKLRLRTVRTQLRAKRRFQKHAQQEPRFERVPRNWVRAPLDAAVVGTCAPLARTYYTNGEICLLQRGEVGTIRVLVEGREIEQVEFASELPFIAIVSDSRLRPDPTYRSVIRDRHYKSMIMMVRSAAIRCVEAMCNLPPAPFVQREAASEEELRILVQKALRAAHSGQLGGGLNRDTPLVKREVWPLVTGGWASLHDLRELKVLATVPSAEEIVATPTHTTVICPDPLMQALLQIRLEPQTFVIHYKAKHLSARPDTALELAQKWVFMNPNAVALAIEEAGLRASIAWGFSKKGLSIRHHGQHLVSHQLPEGTVSLVIDSDEVVPTHDWAEVRDGAGLEERDYAAWEVALVRAFASALVGCAPRELVASTQAIGLESLAGRCFIKAVIDCEDLEQLLGAELLEELQTAFLFRGRSANDLAKMYSVSIDYLDSPPLRLDTGDWQPLIAMKSLAEFAARLAGRSLTNASGQLQSRRDAQERHANRQAHLKQVPISPYSLMQGSPVVIDFHGESVQGLVGIGTSRNQCQLFLLCDERQFFQSELWSKLPLVAALEIDSSLADERFESIPDTTSAQITSEVSGCAQALVEAALGSAPYALANNAEVREFCTLWLEGPESTGEMQKWIVETAMFSDQRGQPLALADSFRDGNPLRTSTYDGEWLEPEEGEARTELDESVLMVPELAASEFKRLWKSIWSAQVSEDVSVDMNRLQMQRRVRQGLVSVPTVPGDANVKRRLMDLVASESLGEICFFDGAQTEVRLYEEGLVSASVLFDTYPTVIVAIEAPELLTSPGVHMISTAERPALQARVERLTLALLQDVLAAGKLPDWLRLQLSRGLLCGDISATNTPELASRALMRTTAGAWVSWEDLVEQEKHFGDVWCVRSGDERTPLDPHRIVLALPPSEFVVKSPLQLVLADEELALDKEARANQAREPLHELALNAEQASYALTSIELKTSDGLQGVVAPLLPRSGEKRGVKAYRTMRSIGHGADPCSWPTLAVINDPALTPNRTWSAPKDDAHWKHVGEAIAKASDDALMKHIPLPKGSITSHWVGRYVESRKPRYLARGIVLRGRLWLTGSTEPGTIEVQGAGGTTHYQLRVAWRGRELYLPVHGKLLCHGAASVKLAPCLQELGDILYSQLLLRVSSYKSIDEDSKAAHIAMGLASKHLKLTDSSQTFSCFAPVPLNASALKSLILGESMVAMSGTEPLHSSAMTPTLINDGSELSKTLVRLLGSRLYHHEAFVPAESVIVALDAEPLALDTKPMEPKASTPPHVLQGLADDFEEHLRTLDLNTGYVAAIHIEPGRTSPLLSLETDVLVFAGDNEHLRAIEAERITGSIRYQGALDLLVMHALAVFNDGWMLVDAGERRALTLLLRQTLSSASENQ